MRELRSIVNACFIFAVFLVCYAFVRPGYVHKSPHPPRFLRMKVEALRGHVPPRIVQLSAPYSLVGGAIRFAALGKLRRELDLCFTDSVDAELLRGVWRELSEKPEGTPVTREGEGRSRLVFRREGSFVVLEIARTAWCEDGDKGAPEEPAEKAGAEGVDEAPPKPAQRTESAGEGAASKAAPKLAETVTLRVPVRIFQAVVDGDHSLDVDSLLAELESAGPGDLLDVKSPDARVRVWVE